jgi:hypothetical protein
MGLAITGASVEQPTKFELVLNMKTADAWHRGAARLPCPR